MKQKVVAILGPTATGKSACAIELARRLNGEIISGDSMLVFKNMNIGTAKPTAEELALMPHHLVDILPPDAQFSVVDFKQQAEALIEDITARGKLPIIAGGTGLYIKAVLENYSFNEVDEDKDLRLELEREAEAKGPEVLYKRLQELDSEAASIIHPNNVRRVIRALESALINNLQKFLLELGKGFSFVARQFRISTETDHFYADLVFYNYLLKCFVVIDLKTTKLSHADIGQMDMYVRMFDQLKRGADDNPTLGIILCTDKSETMVKYSVLEDSKQIFASKYKTVLPTEEELADMIQKENTKLLTAEE